MNEREKLINESTEKAVDDSEILKKNSLLKRDNFICIISNLLSTLFSINSLLKEKEKKIISIPRSNILTNTNQIRINKLSGTDDNLSHRDLFVLGSLELRKLYCPNCI